MHTQQFTHKTVSFISFSLDPAIPGRSRRQLVATIRSFFMLFWIRSASIPNINTLMGIILWYNEFRLQAKGSGEDIMTWTVWWTTGKTASLRDELCKPGCGHRIWPPEAIAVNPPLSHYWWARPDTWPDKTDCLPLCFAVCCSVSLLHSNPMWVSQKLWFPRWKAFFLLKEKKKHWLSVLS